MEKKHCGFSLTELLVIFAIVTLMITISMPGVSVLSAKKSPVLPSSRNCIVKTNATSVTPASGFFKSTDYATMTSDCAGAVRGCSYNDSKSCESTLHYANSGTIAQSNAARTVLKAACDLGGTDACIYFIKRCAGGICEENSNKNDLRYYLELAYTDNSNPGRSIVENETKPHYDMGEPNILVEVDKICDEGIANGIINTACKIKGYMPETKTTIYNFGDDERSSYLEEDVTSGTVFSSGYARLAPNQPPLSVPMNSSWDVDSFTYNGNNYLVYGSAQGGGDTKIFKTNGSTVESIQSISEPDGETTVKIFNIGGTTYLGRTNYYSSANPFASVYRWTGTGFTLVQANLSRVKSNGIGFFYIGATPYLAVANLCTGSNYTQNQNIYQWAGSSFSSTPSYFFNSLEGGWEWAEFEYSGVPILIQVNYHTMDYNSKNSYIYKWTGSNFQNMNSVMGPGTKDVEIFNVDGTIYAAFAHERNNVPNYNLSSIIYKWDNNLSTCHFSWFQDIATNGAQDFEAFKIDGIQYLAVANFYDGSTSNVNSKIYKWNSTYNNFSEFQSIPTKGAYDWESFTIAGVPYIASSEYYNSTQKVYKWNGNGFTIAAKDNAYMTTKTNGISGISKILYVTIAQQEPTNSQVRWLASFDGRITWKKWTGSSWSTVSLSNIHNSGNTKTEFENGLKDLDLDSPNNRFDFAIGFKSTNPVAYNPAADQVRVIYQ